MGESFLQGRDLGDVGRQVRFRSPFPGSDCSSPVSPWGLGEPEHGVPAVSAVLQRAAGAEHGRSVVAGPEWQTQGWAPGNRCGVPRIIRPRQIIRFRDRFSYAYGFLTPIRT